MKKRRGLSPVPGSWTQEVSEWDRFTNDAKGLAAALDWLSDHAVALVMMEATGRLHELAARLLRAAELPVAVVNPGRVRHFARAKGRLAKTDRIDALVLAEYGALMRLAPGMNRDPENQGLAALVLRRRQLVAALACERQRLDAVPPHALDDIVKQSFEAVSTILKKEITAIERYIEDLIATHQVLEARDCLLRSVPSVGPVASHTLIAKVPELGSLTRR